MNIRKLMCAALASAMTLSAASCAAVTDLENRLDSLSSELAGETAAPSAPKETDTETETAAVLDTGEPETTVTEAPETDPPETDQPETTEASEPDDDPVDYWVDYVTLVYACAFAYVDGDYSEVNLSDPQYIWEIIGWYVGRRSYLNGWPATLNADEVQMLQMIISGTGSFIDCPQSKLDEGNVAYSQGVYDFKWYWDETAYYFTTIYIYGFTVSGDVPIVNVTINELDGDPDKVLASSDWTVTYTPTDSVNSYTIESVVQTGERTDNSENHTGLNVGDEIPAEMMTALYDANALSVLAGEDIAVKSMTDYTSVDDRYMSYDWYFRKNGHIASVFYYPDDDESESLLYLNYLGLEIADPGDRVIATGFGVTADEYDESNEDNIKFTVEMYAPYTVTSIDGSTVTAESTTNDSTSYVSFSFDAITFRVLSITSKISWTNDEGNRETDYIYTEYSTVPLSDVPEKQRNLLAAFDGETKQVTEVQMYEYGTTVTYTVPADWEYISQWDMGFIYMDEAGTIPYEYPGNGKDYTIYMIYGEG